jgi:hypothetical protein
MKTIHLLSHPVTILLSFMLILVSGEQMGGFYLLYLLMALPHGGIHALLAVAGTLMLLLSYSKYQRQHKYLIEPVLNILGTGCLFFSLYLFFIRSHGYNNATFEQTMPLLTLGLFAVLSILFLADSVLRFSRSGHDTAAM